MASIALGIVGTAIGGSIGGAILGVSAAAIGGAVGTAIGTAVDSYLVSLFTPAPPAQRIEGARLETARITGATEGAVIPQVFGRMRVGGNVVWATDFREEVVEDRQGGGGKGGIGGGSSPEIITTTYLYYCSFAVALCEGPISGIGRIWADGELMNLEGVDWRWYAGDESQAPDPYIAARTGNETPGYRGTAYLVFEDILLERFGNRIPQLNVEVFRALDEADTAEGATKAVTIIPGTGEFVYATEKVTRKAGGGTTASENVLAVSTTADFRVSLDRLQASCPGIESVSLVVSWFGSDLRAGNCQIRPKVEIASKDNSRAWSVDGISRGSAQVVSQLDGRPAFGGTPSDFSVTQAIQECKARGLRLTLYPFLMMDIPSENGLPDPYSDNAGTNGQPVFPWRGRITCSPAAGYAGSVDKTGDAATQVAAFFNGTWGYRRMVLHYAQLCAAAGGVDAFLIGSELRGLTQVRSSASDYPAVGLMVTLANDCRAILGAGTKISYAADWSEYFGHHPGDGSGDVYFNLDALWAAPNVDFVGIDNYMPLSDWRDGFDHVDAGEFASIYEREYLQSNIEGGEGFDWYYASAGARASQIRTPITDGGAGKPWVFRYKDLRSWWSNQHYNRSGGTESGAPTAWVPESKPIRFTEFGCPAVDRGTNQPNTFYDPKSSESFAPYFSRGWRDDTIQRAYLEAVLTYWRDNANNPASAVYSGRMIDVDECAAWTWDARPYPWFPALDDVWSDGENWRLGHWLNGRLGSVSLAALVRYLCGRAGLTPEFVDVRQMWGGLEGYVIGALESPRASIATLAQHFGFDAVESEGRIMFRMRGRAPAATLSLDDLVQQDGNGDVIEFERGQETELPQAIKWSIARADEEYDTATVEARRITVEASRITSTAFPVAVPPEEAERRVRRTLQEIWVGREGASFRLPPSRLGLDPSDVLAIQHDGRLYDLRLLTTNDGADRALTAIMQDREVYDLPPGGDRAAAVARTILFGEPQVVFLDLPQISVLEDAHQPLIGAYANPWPGSMAIYYSPTLDDFLRLSSFSSRAQFGTTVEGFHSGPTSRFDMGNALVINLPTGTLQSVTDISLFDGANAFAVETAPDVWEIVQAGEVELIGANRYRLTRLLRGLRGTEDQMVATVPAGAKFVVLDSSLSRVPISLNDIDRTYNWLVGPAGLPYTDASYIADEFTPIGRGLLPFAVAHVEQPYRHGRVPGDYTIRWTRRSRDLAADSWATVDVPLGEDVEAYEVDILNGATVLRTLETGAPSAVYTSAQQIADWGAQLGPGSTLTIRIAQLSALLGRGIERTVTLQF
ncbi:MAG: glycoside hydrolase TIM-barrel-like domain-containing protein [Alphaproteobacteria bacterium]|nr:glycoside hydrolase TIM-barrel-like domain-containing protein [Alphaproteobacteria bacterium]